MYYQCKDVESKKIVFIDTSAELEIGNVITIKGMRAVVLKEIEPQSEEAERIPCSELKHIPRNQIQ